MKKRLIGTLLMGALIVSSTSLFVSCKDYDDDINNIVATKADKTELNEAKAALNAEIQTLKGRLETVEGQITTLTTQVQNLSNNKADKFTENGKTYNLQDVWTALNPLIQKEQELRTRIGNAEDAIGKINDLLGGKLENGKTYKEAVEDLYAQVAAIDIKLATAIGRIDGIEADLNTPVTGLKAVVADLGSQVEVLNGYKARVEAIEADYLKSGDKQELLDKIAALKTELEGKIATLKQDLEGQLAAQKQALEGQLAAQKTELEGKITAAENAAKEYANQQANGAKAAANEYTDGKVQLIAADMRNIADQVDALGASLNTLNIYVKNALRSLVFIPETYDYGIEAMAIHSLDYFWYRHLPGYPNNIPAANADTKELVGYVGADAAITATAATAIGAARTAHSRYDSVAASRVIEFAANYHMNPSSANIADAKAIQIVDADRKYVTRASEAGLFCNPDINAHSWKDGILSVNVDVNDLSKIKSITNDGYVTTFATQVVIDNGDADTTITSDYAAVYVDTIRDLRLAHYFAKDYRWNDSYAGVNGWTPAADGNGGYILNTHCGECEITDAGNDPTRSHLMATVAEAAYFAAQDSCDWNDTIDLADIIETHYTTESGTHALMTKDEREKAGLYYKYELTGYYIGTNETSESAQAALKGSLFRPQMPAQDGKAAAWAATEQDRSTIGRTPIVRVSLVWTDPNGVERTLDYGYIRIKITETVNPAAPAVIPTLSITYTGDQYSYTYNGECADPAGNPEPYEVSTTWYQTQYDIYNALMNDPKVNIGSISREEFEAIYKLETTDNGAMPVPYTAGDYSDLQQYNASDFTPITAANKIGIASTEIDVNPENGQATSTLKWTMTAAEAKAFFVTDAGTLNAKAKELTSKGIAVKYQANDRRYPDFYVILQAPDNAKVTVNKPAGKVKWDSFHISNYWYAANANAGGSGNDEIHAQVITPEDATAALCVPLDTRISDVFTGNNLLAPGIWDITDKTAAGEYAIGNLTVGLIFDKQNNGKKYKGVDGRTYVTSVKSGDPKTLEIAWEDDLLTWQTLAVIKNDGAGTGVNHEIVEYQKGNWAEYVLNYAAHNALADDVVTAYVGIQATNRCPKDLPLTYTPFATRFLRPINAYAQPVDPIEDANPNQVQVINLRDLVRLTDWRDEPFKTTPKDYWAYYNIKKIEIDGAAADGSDVTEYIYTNLNQADAAPFVALNTVTSQIELTYAPVQKTTGSYGSEASYGTITYKNNSNALGQFDLKFKVRVTYEWGYVLTEDVTIHVNSTRNNARKF